MKTSAGGLSWVCKRSETKSVKKCALTEESYSVKELPQISSKPTA